MEAFPLSGVYAAMALAAKIVSLRRNNPTNEEKDKGDEAGALVGGLREALQTMATAASLITYIQDPYDPLVSDGSYAEGESQEVINPAELLRKLADAWDNSQAMNWDEDVEMFTSTFNKTMEDISVEEFNKAFPGDINVSDILGE